MKKFLTAVALLGLIGLGSRANAVTVGNPVDAEVYAQINGTLQITLTATSFDFGTVNAGTTSYSTSAVTVQNTGGGLAETYQVKGNNTTSGDWTLVNNYGVNQFGLDAQFNTTQPLAGSWNSNHTLTTGYQTSAAGGKFAGNLDGFQTAQLETVNLWFRFRAPGSSTFTTRERIQIDITTTGP